MRSCSRRAAHHRGVVPLSPCVAVVVRLLLPPDQARATVESPFLASSTPLLDFVSVGAARPRRGYGGMERE